MNYTSVSLSAQLLQGTLVFDIPGEFFGKEVYLGIEVNFLGAGASKGLFSDFGGDTVFKVGATAFIGGNVILGIKSKD